jgi:hypothetical protein
VTAAAGWSPRHRPPVGLRVLAAALGGATVLFNAALMISDRAPGLLRRLFGDWVRRLSERIDAGGRVMSVASDPRLPENDSLVHIAVWALAMGLVGIAVWTWRSLFVGGIVVFGCSLVVEFSQGRLSDTREMEVSDILANALGVILGVVAVGFCYLLWSTLAIVFGSVARRR